jgi:hypothetical protein
MQSIPPVIELTKGHFEPFVGQTFRVENLTGHIDLRLVRVTGHPKFTLPNALRESFSLLFRDDHARWIPPVAYNMRHPRFGLIEGVLVTPVLPPPEYIQPGRTDGPTFFEIGFN